MLGIILCGGQSTRMGSDKGMLQLHGQTWAQAAAATLVALHLPVRLSVNAAQQPEYEKLFDTTLLITDNTDIPVIGPLLGLLSAHLQYPGEDLFILACDMQLMKPALLHELNRAADQQKADAFVFTNDGEPEPLCGIYTAIALHAILDKAMHNELQRFSMKYMLQQLQTYRIPIREDQKICFRNFNAQEELDGLV